MPLLASKSDNNAKATVPTTSGTTMLNEIVTQDVQVVINNNQRQSVKCCVLRSAPGAAIPIRWGSSSSEARPFADSATYTSHLLSAQFVLEKRPGKGPRFVKNAAMKAVRAEQATANLNRALRQDGIA
jgi:hypothetical protein